MQGDGNLVFLRGGHALWNAQTWRFPGATAHMQADGNLVVYSADRQPRFDTKTFGNAGAWLNVQDDDNLVVYGANGAALWSSHFGRRR
jgi:hypothetical protein